MNDDPFAALGLPARISVSDDDVRAAWRRIAAATHPDREDGGDPARFGAAAAAYAMLRTGYSRSEALADLDLAGRAPAGRRVAGPGRHARSGRARGGPAQGDRARGGPPQGGQARGGRRAWSPPAAAAAFALPAVRGSVWKLAARGVAAGAVCAGALVVAGWSPATIGVLAGSITWVAMPLARDPQRRDGRGR